jgi:hypothetical protein
MLRILTAVVAVVATILYLHHQKSGPTAIKLSGTLDCSSGQVNFTKGPLKGRSFPSMASAMNVLERRGYSGKGLEQLPMIFNEACSGRLLNPDSSRGDLSGAALVPVRYSGSSSSSSSQLDYSILRLGKLESGFSFDVFNVDLKSHGGSLPAYVQRQGKGKPRNCKQTSYDPPANCYKCENPLEAWCTMAAIKG